MNDINNIEKYLSNEFNTDIKYYSDYYNQYNDEIYSQYNEKLCELPDSIRFLMFGTYFNQLIDNLPLNLSCLIFCNNF